MVVRHAVRLPLLHQVAQVAGARAIQFASIQELRVQLTEELGNLEAIPCEQLG